MSYDTQQVCENGHRITGCYRISTDKQQKFCRKCGAPTMIACPDCNTEIQGDPIQRGRGGHLYSMYSVDVPSYCDNCGKAYPWTQNKIRTAIQLFAEFGNLDDDEKKTIEEDINNIAKNVPQAEISAMRIKRIWKKCEGLAYDIIMDLASRTIAEMLKNPSTL